MKSDAIVRFSLEDLERQDLSRSDWERIEGMSEEEIERLALEENAQLGIPDDWFKNLGILSPRPGKEKITIRLDEDVLAFFRRQGEGYQTRINAVLRAYVASVEREREAG